MGVSLLILGISDMYYKELFPSYAHTWTEGLVCKLVGFLSILSNEASVFLITLLSIDRYLAIKNPLTGRRFTIKIARVSVLLVWLITTLISAIAIGLAGEKSDIFKTSEVCIGIPIIRPQETKININRIRLNETTFVSEKSSYW